MKEWLKHHSSEPAFLILSSPTEAQKGPLTILSVISAPVASFALPSCRTSAVSGGVDVWHCVLCDKACVSLCCYV